MYIMLPVCPSMVLYYVLWWDYHKPTDIWAFLDWFVGPVGSSRFKTDRASLAQVMDVLRRFDKPVPEQWRDYEARLGRFGLDVQWLTFQLAHPDKICFRARLEPIVGAGHGSNMFKHHQWCRMICWGTLWVMSRQPGHQNHGATCN